MSKIGKMPVIITEGVTVSQENGKVTVAGPKGALTFVLPSAIDIAIQDGKVVASQKESRLNTKALFGLTRATIANMIKGVSEGFERKLELSGVGYRASISGRDLMLSVGFSHQVKIPAPQNITFSVAENVITVSGIDKTLVGDTAVKIRAIRTPEPYKGKGIKFLGEKIRRKAGKAAKAVGTK